MIVQSRLANSDFAHDHFEKDSELDKGVVPRVWDPEPDGKSLAGTSDYGSEYGKLVSYTQA